VQALETLIRSGSNMDAEAASTAAMETILHATRAANSGSQDANSALAQLTQSGVGSMSQDAQSNLLMDVLQQVGNSLSSMNQTDWYVYSYPSRALDGRRRNRTATRPNQKRRTPGHLFPQLRQRGSP